MTERHTRYQGAIVRDHHLLLLLHRRHADGRGWWALPGGGIEPGEGEEQCVVREMREETNLEVRVERLLLDYPGSPKGVYRRLKTYLCTPISGEAAPGYEPETEAAAAYALVAVAWLDLRSESAWEADIVNDDLLYPALRLIRQALGYL